MARILVVEDEVLVAMDLTMLIETSGHSVIGPCTSLGQGVEAARAGKIDFALLDVNLRNEPSIAIADILADRGVPFAFVTGYRQPEIAEQFEGAHVVAKPIGSAKLDHLLKVALPG